jgi:hypothetical protein
MAKTTYYSSIQHLARCMALSGWEACSMVMLTTAFDFSYHESGDRMAIDDARKFTVVAGFVSDAREWEEFDRNWRARLSQDRLTYFHMQKFAQSSGPFKGWDKQEARRQELMADLLGLISGHAYRKFGVVVPRAGLEALQLNPEMPHHAEAIATSNVIAMVEEWKHREKYHRATRYVFEQGDRAESTIRETAQRITGLNPAFEYKREYPEKGIVAFTPLQAADIFAYELKKLADRLEDTTSVVPGDVHFRVPYEALNKMQQDAMLVTDGLGQHLGTNPRLFSIGHEIRPEAFNPPPCCAHCSGR